VRAAFVPLVKHLSGVFGRYFPNSGKREAGGVSPLDFKNREDGGILPRSVKEWPGQGLRSGWSEKKGGSLEPPFCVPAFFGPLWDRKPRHQALPVAASRLLKEVFHSTDGLYELRRLVSAYEDLVKAGVRSQNQKKCLQQAHGDTGKHSTFIMEHLDQSIELYRSSKQQYERKLS
jgi:hypothetical protein